MSNIKRIPPKRNDLLVEVNGVPTRRAVKFFESLAEQITPISDLSGTPTNIQLRDKINEILAGLRSIGIVET